MRLDLSRPLPRVLTALATVCFTLTVSVAGSNVIFSLANGAELLYVAGDLLSLSVGLFAGARMADTFFSVPSPKNNTDEEELQ
jgi:hypothetical protein